MQLNWKTLGRTVGAAALVTLALAGGYEFYLNRTGNFATVVAGEVYRSAQPTAGSLTKYQQENGIRSIINLRGENTGTDWYDEEVAASKKLGIQHFDFRMDARKELPHERVLQLVALMEKAPKPLLIHCKAGADRTSLASAFYLAAIAKQGEEAAESQISFRYGHLSLPFIPEYNMDNTFENNELWLGYEDS